MARYVVLSFPSNDDADYFVREMTEGHLLEGGAEVLGLFAQPTQFHTYQDCPGRKRRVQGWVRGLTFGWWVCSDCKKPARPMGKTTGAMAENLMRHVVGQAVNLLRGAPNQLTDVRDEGWGTTKTEVHRDRSSEDQADG